MERGTNGFKRGDEWSLLPGGLAQIADALRSVSLGHQVQLLSLSEEGG